MARAMRDFEFTPGLLVRVTAAVRRTLSQLPAPVQLMRRANPNTGSAYRRVDDGK
jgi:hypothetical protein